MTTVTPPCVGDSCTCTRVRVVGPMHYELAFAKPQGFRFFTGQYVLAVTPHPDDPSDVVDRGFSLASSPEDPELLLLVKPSPGGRTSMWIERILREGTTVSIKGPFGNFLLDHRTNKEYLFIATGTGIAPLRSHIRSLLLAGETRRIDLVHGARTEEERIWHEEFQLLAAKYPNFSLHYALTNPSQSWQGHRGRVQTLMPNIIRDLSQRSVYICGHAPMVQELTRLCIIHWGVPREDVHGEGF